MIKNSISRRTFMEHSVVGAAAVTAAASRALGSQGEMPSIIPATLGAGERLRVGVIGCGNRSRILIRAVDAHPNMEIVGLSDVVPEKMDEKKALIRNGSPQLHRDYQELLKRSDIQAVVIALPNTLHMESSIASLEAGKHVFCEKPLTLDVADSLKIMDAVRRTRRVLQVGTQTRHSPYHAEVTRQVREGLVGNVLYAWINNFRADWVKLFKDPEEDARKNWRMKQSEGGAVQYEMGIHTLDAFCWVIGSTPEEITCIGGVNNKRLQKRDSWDHVGILVRYANGAMATYGANLYSCGGPGPDVLFGDKGTLEFSRGNAKLHLRSYWRPFGMGEDPNSEVKEIPLPGGGGDPSVLQFGHFFESVLGRKPVFPSPWDHLPALQIARGSLLSMAERRHVRVSEIP